MTVHFHKISYVFQCSLEIIFVHVFSASPKTMMSLLIKCLMSSVIEEISLSMFAPDLTKPLDL